MRNIFKKIIWITLLLLFICQIPPTGKPAQLPNSPEDAICIFEYRPFNDVPPTETGKA